MACSPVGQEARFVTSVACCRSHRRSSAAAAVAVPPGAHPRTLSPCLGCWGGEESRGRVPPPSKRIPSIAMLVCAPLFGFRRDG